MPPSNGVWVRTEVAMQIHRESNNINQPDLHIGDLNMGELLFVGGTVDPDNGKSQEEVNSVTTRDRNLFLTIHLDAPCLQNGVRLVPHLLIGYQL